MLLIHAVWFISNLRKSWLVYVLLKIWPNFTSLVAYPLLLSVSYKKLLIKETECRWYCRWTLAYHFVKTCLPRFWSKMSYRAFFGIHGTSPPSSAYTIMATAGFLKALKMTVCNRRVNLLNGLLSSVQVNRAGQKRRSPPIYPIRP